MSEFEQLSCRKFLVAQGMPTAGSSCYVCGSILRPDWKCKFDAIDPAPPPLLQDTTSPPPLYSPPPAVPQHLVKLVKAIIAYRNCDNSRMTGVSIQRWNAVCAALDELAILGAMYGGQKDAESC